MTSRRKTRSSKKKAAQKKEKGSASLPSDPSSSSSSSEIRPEEKQLAQVFTEPLEDLYADRLILPPIPPGQEVVFVSPSRQSRMEQNFKRNNIVFLSRISSAAETAPMLSRWLANFFFGSQFSKKDRPGSEREPASLLEAWNKSLLKSKKPRLHQRNVRLSPLSLVTSFPMACYPNGDLKEPLFRRMMDPDWEQKEQRAYPHIEEKKLKQVTFRDRNRNWEWLLVIPDDVVAGGDSILHPTIEPILGFLAEHNEVLFQGFVLPWTKFMFEAKDVCPCMSEVNIRPPFILTEQLPPVVGTEAVHSFLSAFALASALVPVYV